MSTRYIYADKVGAGPEHPNKQWGLFTKELSAQQAAERYALDAERSQDWFGIVRLKEGETRPSAYLQIRPQANGVALHALDANGAVTAAYSFGVEEHAERETPGGAPRLFLSQIFWYAYPDGDHFYDMSESVGNVEMQFRPDGYAKEDRTTDRGFGEPSHVETREFRNVDMSANWFDIPQFGDWEALFNPTPQE